MRFRTPRWLADYCRRVLPRMFDAVDAARALHTVKAIVATDRWTSFDRYHDTSRMLVREYRAAGAQAQVYTAQTGGQSGTGRWVVQQAQDVRALTVDVVRPVCRRIADYRRNPWHHIRWGTSTPPGGMTNELVVVDSQDALDRIPRNGLVGKMVLTRANVSSQAHTWADKGAVGLLVDKPVRGLPKATGWLGFGWGGLPVDHGTARLVGVALSENAGNQLRQLVQKHGKVVVKTRVDLRTHVGSHDVVSGIVQGGADPQDEVWALAHSAEPGAADNASGVAVCLEIARCIESLVARGELPRPKRTIRLLNGYECYGFFHYLEHTTRLQTPLAGVCIDCIGLAPSRCDRRLEWHATLPMSAGFVEGLGEGIVRAALRIENPGYRCVPAGFVSTADTLIGDPKYGFPCPWLATYRKGTPGYEGYHSSADTPELLHPKGLAVASAAMAAYLYFLADADSRHVAQIAAWETARTLHALGASGKKLSKSDAEFARDRHHMSMQRLQRWMWGGDRSTVLSHLAECERSVREAVAARTAPAERPRHTRVQGAARVPRRKAPITPTIENTPQPIAQRIRDAKLPPWSLFWADGQRTLAQIATALACDLKKEVDVKQVVGFFEAHRDLGYVDLIEPGDMVSKAQIVRDLKALGVAAGMDLMVHSSLSQMGHVAGGPSTVVSALLAAVGKSGTLVMPSFNHSRAEVFNPLATPTANGAIADAMWRRPDCVRSLHHSHAVAAIGPRAEEFTPGHLDTGIWEQDSPIGRLIHGGGHILSLGVKGEARTAYHVAENSMPCGCIDPFGTRCKIVAPDGRVRQVRGLAWRAGACPVPPERINQTLDRRRLQRRGKVGRADATLVKAKVLWDVRREHLRHACPVCKIKPKAYSWPSRRP